MESGVAERPMEDMQAYEAKLNQSVFKSALLMKPVFEAKPAKARAVLSLPKAKTNGCCGRRSRCCAKQPRPRS